jgi:hypothetical protein
VLLSDEQNYCWRKEKGVCIEHQIGLYELLTKPRMKAI